ncbi:hypothetical protein Pelo_15074 [Pelomyxa schiedti]|nr:hypothetical protein Pelo_15074 [Pelomyxa schiedti]
MCRSALVCSIFLVVGVFGGSEVYPQASFLATLNAYDPLGAAACILSGDPAIQPKQSNYEATEVCDDVGMITLNVAESEFGLTFGRSGSTMSSYANLGTTYDLRESCSIDSSVDDETIFTSLHLDTSSNQFVVAQSILSTGEISWTQLPSSLVTSLYTTTASGNTDPLIASIGNIYLLRLTTSYVNSDQSVLYDTLSLAKLVPAGVTTQLQGMAVRWSVFWTTITVPPTPEQAGMSTAETAKATSTAAMVLVWMAVVATCLLPVLLYVVHQRESAYHQMN